MDQQEEMDQDQMEEQQDMEQYGENMDGQGEE
jgi:hypothetical protein